ncbi:MAG: porin [Pseudomonadota bacterium]
MKSSLAIALAVLGACTAPVHGQALPVMHDLADGATYGIEQVPGNRAWGRSIGTGHGVFSLRLAQQYRTVAKVAPATSLGNDMDARNTILAANLKAGIVTAYVAYSANRGWGSSPLWNPDNPYGAVVANTPSTDSRDVLVGLALPLGATTLLASTIRKNDRDLANRDARQVAFGASYALSRRSDFYASWSRTSYHEGGAAGAINIGLRHAF